MARPTRRVLARRVAVHKKENPQGHFMRRRAIVNQTKDAILLNHARSRFLLLRRGFSIDLIGLFHPSYRDSTKRLHVRNHCTLFTVELRTTYTNVR